MKSPSSEAEIYAVLSKMLLSGALAPGIRLGEMELAGAFQVSRERVRKVLHRLGAERWIELVPNRGAFVASPKLSTAREIYDARRMLEGGILLALADSLTDEQLNELEADLARQHEASHQGDRALMVQLSGEFHIKLAAMSGNTYLIRFTQEMVNRASMLAAFFEQTTPMCGYKEHENIVSALRQRNGPLAAQMGALHLSLIETRLKMVERSTEPDLDIAALVRAEIKSLSQ